MNIMMRTKNTGQLNIDRVFARLFVLLGGVFWVFAFFGANTKASYSNFVYTLPELEKAATMALIPLAIVVFVFVLGLFYERLTGIVLVAIALAMLVWGLVNNPGEVVLWVTALSILVAPTVVSAAMYELAARRQEAQELEMSTGTEAGAAA
jgi:hypothetical protein